LEQIKQGKMEVAKISERCKLADSRSDALSRQISVLVKKESELIQDRKSMQRDLDRALMERERAHVKKSVNPIVEFDAEDDLKRQVERVKQRLNYMKPTVPSPTKVSEMMNESDLPE
jgi:hypothetical protein